MLQWVVLSRPIILPHVGNSPCDKLSLTDSDIKFIYIIFMYLVLLLHCFILLRSDRCSIKAVNSQTSWRQRLVETHSFAVS